MMQNNLAHYDITDILKIHKTIISNENVVICNILWYVFIFQTLKNKYISNASIFDPRTTHFSIRVVAVTKAVQTVELDRRMSFGG